MTKNLKSTTRLNDGHLMPWLGLGVWKVEDRKTLIQAVQTALDTGYISLDTAAAYQNEAFVGEAIKSSGIAREKLFVTTKLWNRNQIKGYDATIKACKESLQKMQMDYVDLYLIHWPVPSKDMYPEAWQALVDLQKQGLARSIGVSNFHPHHIEKIIETTGVVPAVNQVELHPWLNQKDLITYCRDKSIQIEAYSPLMGGHLSEEPALAAIAERCGKTPAQVVLRWHLQNEVVIIPKSVHDHRIRENADLFDFELTVDDLQAIDLLNRDHRFLPDPDHMAFY
ncbi:MAG: aldo/keto reductase [Eubacteriales bacterium]|nr:aldo/keto reductase [Eubacteriales bacterium]MDD4462130.1 aldo/keto reductase [Eubacteriales bacterium]